MENGPVSCIFKDKDLIYGINRSLVINERNIDFEHTIKAVKISDSHIVVIFKRSFAICDRSSRQVLLRSRIFTSNIVDIQLVNHQISVLLFDGNLITLSLDMSDKLNKKKLFNKTIICGKIKGNKILIGSFDSYYIYCLDTQKLINQSFIENRGRIFDVDYVKDQIICCSDDRCIYLDNVSIISADNNYFTKVELVDDTMFCSNRDGILRIYRSNNLIYNQDFGFSNICCFYAKSRDEVLVGTVDGRIFEIKNMRITCIRGIFKSILVQEHLLSIKGIEALYSCGAFFCRNYIFYGNKTLKVPEKPIDFYSDKSFGVLLYGSTVIIVNYATAQALNLNIQMLREYFCKVDLHENVLKVSNDQSCFSFCMGCLNLLHQFKVSKISTMKQSFVGTKNGWLTNGNICQKISNHQIVDINIDQEYINVLDSSGSHFFIDKHSLGTISCKECDKTQTIFDHATTQTHQNMGKLNNNQKNNTKTFYSTAFDDFFDSKEFIEAIAKYTDLIQNSYFEYNKNVEVQDNILDSLCNVLYDISNFEINEIIFGMTELTSKKHVVFNSSNTEDMRNVYARKNTSIANGMFLNQKNSLSLIERKKNMAFYSELLLNLVQDYLSIYQVSNQCCPGLKFSNFTSFSKVTEDITLLGTDDGALFLLCQDEVSDQFGLEGSILEIFCIEEYAIVFTNIGCIYKMVVKDRKIFLIKDIQMNHKISAASKMKFATSNGQVFDMDINLNTRAILNTNKFISSMYESIISYEGYITSLDLLHDKKICEKNIYCIKQFKNNFICTGDDQQIAIFDPEYNIKLRTSPHSSQVFDLEIFGQFIVSVSSDMTVCILNDKLEIVDYVSHTVRNPRKILKIDDRSFYLLGESIEKVQILKLIFTKYNS